MLSEKHLIRKYTNPHDLLLYHFNPTLLEKYKDDIIKNDEGLKKLLSQSIRRIAQLFVQGEKTENEIGKKISSHGLLPLYLQARKSGCRIIEENDKFDDLDDKGFDRAPKREKIYKKVLYEIQYEKWKPQFSDQYILNLSKSTGVKEQVIDDIIKNVHTGNKNIVHEVLKNLIKKYGHNTILQEKNIDVFIKMSFDQKTNISEERYNDAIKRLLYYLMKKIFSKLNNIKYNRYKETQQRKIMKVILHGIIFNYQEAFECRKPKLTIKQQTNN
jgi:hypothetical protein